MGIECGWLRIVTCRIIRKIRCNLLEFYSELAVFREAYRINSVYIVIPSIALCIARAMLGNLFSLTSFINSKNRNVYKVQKSVIRMLTFCPLTGRINNNLLADGLLTAANLGLVIFKLLMGDRLLVDILVLLMRPLILCLQP